MTTIAQDRLAEVAAWIALSSGGRKSPLGDETIVGPFAVLVASDLDAAPMAGFADKALPLFVPRSQCEGVETGAIDFDAPASQDHVKERLLHLMWKIESNVLPKCRLVPLTDPTEPLQAAIVRAGADDTDLDALPLLCVPLFALDDPFARVAVELRLAAIAR